MSQHPRSHHHHHSPHGRAVRSGFSFLAGSSSGLHLSPPPHSRAFRGINCRSASHSGAGILPPPLSAFPPSSPPSISTTTTSSSTSPSSSASSPRAYRVTDLPSPRSEPPPRRHHRPSRRSSPIPITTKRTTSLPSPSILAAGDAFLLLEDGIGNTSSYNSGSCHTELWAGPAYSNSPPPSSLPIPKFSLRGKRSASLGLPEQMGCEDLRPLPKSAPASPSRESSTGSPPANRFFSHAFATWDLCRILNLNLDED